MGFTTAVRALARQRFHQSVRQRDGSEDGIEPGPARQASARRRGGERSAQEKELAPPVRFWGNRAQSEHADAKRSEREHCAVYGVGAALSPLAHDFRQTTDTLSKLGVWADERTRRQATAAQAAAQEAMRLGRPAGMPAKAPLPRSRSRLRVGASRPKVHPKTDLAEKKKPPNQPLFCVGSGA